MHTRGSFLEVLALHALHASELTSFGWRHLAYFRDEMRMCVSVSYRTSERPGRYLRSGLVSCRGARCGDAWPGLTAAWKNYLVFVKGYRGDRSNA